MTLTNDTNTDVREYYRLVEEGHVELGAIRQRGKAPSFGMQYGAYPPKIQSSIKCTMEEAESIFNRYHNELYPGVTKFREEYVVPTVTKDRKIHMGLGAYMKTDNPNRDIRTLTNGCSQFWSILTLLSINKMHQLIDAAGLQNDVKCISTIYDSIYYTVTDKPEIIKWVNDNLVACMVQDFIPDQTVQNTAIAEIGLDWASLNKISNNASIEEITATLKDIYA